MHITGDPSFELIGPDRAALAPGDSATLDVAVTPQTEGTLSAAIDVYVDGDPTSQATITVATTAIRRPHHGGCAASQPANALALALVLLGWLARRRTR